MRKEYFRKSPIERFLSKINIIDSGCWEWTGCKVRGGYGRLKIKNKMNITHRFIYEYYHGMICPDLTIDHLCRNRICCNPNHLEQVTPRENVLRGIGVTAINARKTHCIHGHEFTPENTYRKDSHKRRCRSCHNELAKKSRLSHKNKKINLNKVII